MVPEPQVSWSGAEAIASMVSSAGGNAHSACRGAEEKGTRPAETRPDRQKQIPLHETRPRETAQALPEADPKFNALQDTLTMTSTGRGDPSQPPSRPAAKRNEKRPPSAEPLRFGRAFSCSRAYTGRTPSRASADREDGQDAMTSPCWEISCSAQSQIPARITFTAERLGIRRLLVKFTTASARQMDTS